MYHGNWYVSSKILGRVEYVRLGARSWLEITSIGQDLFFDSFYSAPQLPVSEAPRLPAYCHTASISAHNKH